MHIERTVPSATTPGLESSDAAAAPRASALSPEEQGATTNRSAPVVLQVAAKTAAFTRHASPRAAL